MSNSSSNNNAFPYDFTSSSSSSSSSSYMTSAAFASSSFQFPSSTSSYSSYAPVTPSSSSEGLASFWADPLGSNNVYRSINTFAAPSASSSSSVDLLETFHNAKHADAWALQHAQPQVQQKQQFEVAVLPSSSSSISTAINVPSCPAYVERYTTFLSSASPSIIFDSLRTAFSSHAVEFEVCEADAKIKAIAYDGSSSSHFLVYLYTSSSSSPSPSSSSYVVEFQRRSGCVVTFNKLYTATTIALRDIIAAPYDSTCTIPSASSSLALPPPLALTTTIPLVGSEQLTLDESTCNILCTMCLADDDFIASREAMCALANASYSESTLVACKSQLSDVLRKVFNNKLVQDEQIVRCGTLLLKTIVSAHMTYLSTIFTTTLFTELLQDMYVRLDVPGRCGTIDMKRQIAIVLSLLSTSAAPSSVRSLLYSPDRVTLLRKYQHVDDVVLAEAIQTTLNNQVTTAC